MFLPLSVSVCKSYKTDHTKHVFRPCLTTNDDREETELMKGLRDGMTWERKGMKQIKMSLKHLLSLNAWRQNLSHSSFVLYFLSFEPFQPFLVTCLSMSCLTSFSQWRGRGSWCVVWRWYADVHCMMSWFQFLFWLCLRGRSSLSLFWLLQKAFHTFQSFPPLSLSLTFTQSSSRKMNKK